MNIVKKIRVLLRNMKNSWDIFTSAQGS